MRRAEVERIGPVPGLLVPELATATELYGSRDIIYRDTGAD